MTLAVSVAEVRAYLKLEANNPTGSSQYSDATITSNILASQGTIEQGTSRWWVDRPAVTWTGTSLNRTVVAIPGFRAFTSITQNGTALAFSGAGQVVFPIADNAQSGLYVGLQFRAFDPYRARAIYSDPLWWDKGMDLPLGRGPWYQTSQPADLVVVGDGGYTTSSYPFAFLHAVKVLAGFYTQRPNSLLADVAITPQGGVINYSQLPAEVAAFIKEFRAGPQVVSV